MKYHPNMTDSEREIAFALYRTECLSLAHLLIFKDRYTPEVIRECFERVKEYNSVVRRIEAEDGDEF